MKKTLFLRWAVIASVTLVGALVAWALGWFAMMYAGDATKLTVVTLVVFAAAAVWCGILSWRVDALSEAAEQESSLPAAAIKRIEREAQHGWFAIDLCVELGLLGTVFGLVMMLAQGFSGFETGDSAAIGMLIERLRAGMSTAFITTLVGGISGILLKVQYHLLAQAVERNKP